MKAPLIVLDYGMGNIHSITKALRLYWPDVRYSKDERELGQACALVLPGDGAFAAAMDRLHGNLKQSLLDFVSSGRPLLGICIGFQILFSESEEAPAQNTKQKTRGLALIPGRIQKFCFADKTRIPHMGWNRLLLQPDSNFAASLNNKYMYFIHSYYAAQVPKKFAAAYCSYAGQSFPAIVKKENITATQFHPEKSSQAGLDFIENWTKTI